LTVFEYLDRAGLGVSTPTGAAKVTTALRRLELGSFSNVQGVGAGVFE